MPTLKIDSQQPLSQLHADRRPVGHLEARYDATREAMFFDEALTFDEILTGRG